VYYFAFIFQIENILL
jgi:hypothetical protein